MKQNELNENLDYQIPKEKLTEQLYGLSNYVVKLCSINKL